MNINIFFRIQILYYYLGFLLLLFCRQYYYNLFNFFFFFFVSAGLASVILPTKVRRQCCVHPSCITNNSLLVVGDITIIRTTDTSHSLPRRYPVGYPRAKTKCRRPAPAIYKRICNPCSIYLGLTTVWTWYVYYV